MKNKTVTLKGFLSVYDVSALTRNNLCGTIEFSTDKKGEFDKAATLTIEVPIPERQVTITESEFDAYAAKWQRKFERSGGLNLAEIKSKLFKEPAHD